MNHVIPHAKRPKAATIREINQAIQAHANGRGPMVYGATPGGEYGRLIRVKWANGVGFGQFLSDGKWHMLVRVDGF